MGTPSSIAWPRRGVPVREGHEEQRDESLTFHGSWDPSGSTAAAGCFVRKSGIFSGKHGDFKQSK